MGEILVPIQEYKELVQKEQKLKEIKEALYQNTKGKFTSWRNTFEPYLNIETEDFFNVFKVIDPEFYDVLLEDKYDEAKKDYESEKEETNVSE